MSRQRTDFLSLVTMRYEGECCMSQAAVLLT